MGTCDYDIIEDKGFISCVVAIILSCDLIETGFSPQPLWSCCPGVTFNSVFGAMSIRAVYVCRRDCSADCLTTSPFAAKGGEYEGWSGGFSACWTGGLRNKVPRCMQVVRQTESPQQPQPDGTAGTHVSGVHWLSSLSFLCIKKCVIGVNCAFTHILVTKLSFNTFHHQPSLFSALFVLWYQHEVSTSFQVIQQPILGNAYLNQITLNKSTLPDTPKQPERVCKTSYGMLSQLGLCRTDIHKEWFYHPFPLFLCMCAWVAVFAGSLFSYISTFLKWQRGRHVLNDSVHILLHLEPSQKNRSNTHMVGLLLLLSANARRTICLMIGIEVTWDYSLPWAWWYIDKCHQCCLGLPFYFSTNQTLWN